MLLHSENDVEMQKQYQAMKVKLRNKISNILKSLLQTHVDALAIMCYDTHIRGICKQQALEKEKDISASKVLHVGELVSESETDERIHEIFWVQTMVQN